jgi:hypothetical protein
MFLRTCYCNEEECLGGTGKLGAVGVIQRGDAKAQVTVASAIRDSMMTENFTKFLRACYNCFCKSMTLLMLHKKTTLGFH